MILIRRPDPDEPEDNRTFEEQLLDAMMRPLEETPPCSFLRADFPHGADMETVMLWLQGHKIEDADVNPELL
jgi:hypothetical protein